MKHITQSFSILAAFALGLILLAGCNKEFVPEEATRYLQLKFDFDEYTDVEVRSPGTTVENAVHTLDVIFFDTATGVKTTLRNGSTPYYFFNVSNPNNAEWKDNNPGTNTAIIPMTPAEAIGKTVVVVANMKETLRARLPKNATNEITTLAELKTLFASQTSVDEMVSPFMMVAEQAITSTQIPEVRADQTINVLLERIIAKVTIHLYYDWNKLVPNHATERGKYTFKDFDKDSYLYLQQTMSATRIDGTEKIIPATTLPAPTFQTTTIEAYINEYKLENPMTSTLAPYVLLDLPAVLGKEFIATNGNIFPPPAGDGENYDNTPVRNFYKLVMPREIKRNHSYVIHATIMNYGGATPDAAKPVPFRLTVANWDESTIYVHEPVATS